MKLKYIPVITLIALVLIASSGCIFNGDDDDSVTSVDTDGDGWSDEQESIAGTAPDNKDTDSDGYWDPLDENPLNPDIPVPRVTPEPPTPVETVAPTPEPTQEPAPIAAVPFEIVYPADGDEVPRTINVMGRGGYPGAEVRIRVITDDEGDRLRPDFVHVDSDGNWGLESVQIWPAKGYPMGEDAVIYAVMTVSESGRVTRTEYSEKITIYFD